MRADQTPARRPAKRMTRRVALAFSGLLALSACVPAGMSGLSGNLNTNRPVDKNNSTYCGSPHVGLTGSCVSSLLRSFVIGISPISWTCRSRASTYSLMPKPIGMRGWPRSATGCQRRCGDHPGPGPQRRGQRSRHRRGRRRDQRAELLEQPGDCRKQRVRAGPDARQRRAARVRIRGAQRQGQRDGRRRTDRVGPAGHGVDQPGTGRNGRQHRRHTNL